MGKSWPGSDIDIFVHESEAPKIRKWLLYEDQVFAGCSAGYGNATNRDVFDYNVSHVEYYINRDDSKYSYADAIDRGRRFKRHHILPLSGYVEVCTSDGEPMPFQSFLDLGAKKDIVNIDLIVVRSGRSVYDALDVFDLNICKSRFDGREWVIPQPLQTFKGCTELTGIVDNIIAKTYLAGIISESQRDIVSIVNEMDLYRFKRRYGAGDSSGVKSLVDKLVSVGNVFSCTIQPIVARSLSPHVHFVCLVTDVRNHLIRNALERVREIGLLGLQSREVVLGINEWLSSSDRPLFLHNSIIRLWFKRFDKYLKRGVFIKDLLPDNCSRQASSDMLRFLPSFSEVVRGVTWPGEDQAIGDWSDVAPSADGGHDSSDREEEGGAEDGGEYDDEEGEDDTESRETYDVYGLERRELESAYEYLRENNSD